MTAPHGAHAVGSSGGRQAAGAGPAAAPGSPEPTPLSEMSLEDAVHQVEAEEHEGRPPAAGPLENLLIAAAVIALGVAALIGSAALGLGSARDPDSGTFPWLVSVVLVLLGLALALTARRSHDAERFTGASGLVLAGLATMVAFVAVISVIGFEIPAALLAFVWLRFLGHEGWRTSILTSLGVVVAFYLVFVVALSVPIPHLF
jgi:putative tricarboxylic transport membrane protein